VVKKPEAKLSLG